MRESENGLRLSTIKSQAVNVENIEILNFDSLKSLVKANFEQKGICVFFLDYKVVIGNYDGNDFRFYEAEKIEPRFIQKMRLFNSNRELFIWRKNKTGFGKRLRIDGDGIDVDVVETMQVLWGTKSEQQGDFTELSEERGTKLILPIKELEVDNHEKRAFIRTRNYISYKTFDDTYKQAGYEDCRFVAFTDKEGNPYGV